MNTLKNKDSIIYISFFLIAIFFMTNLFSNNYYLGDDTQFHIANITAIKESFNSFTNIIFPSKIVPLIANNLGYAIGIFYPRLPHYLGGIIYYLASQFGLDATFSLKLLHFLTIFASGVTMYHMAKSLSQNKNIAFLSAIFYMNLPYLFVDIFQRDALNESFLFVFMPLVFLGLNKLLTENKVQQFYLLFVIGYVGMIYSHLVMSIYFTLMVIIYLLFFFKQVIESNNFKHLFIAAILILILTSTFTVPMIEHKLFGDHFIFNKEYNKYSDLWTINPFEIFIEYKYKSSETTVLFFNISYVSTLFLLFIPFCFKKISKVQVKQLKAIFSFVIIAILFCCSDKIWTMMPNMLKNIQFAWRVSLFIGLGLSYIAAHGLLLFKEKHQRSIIIFATIILLILSYRNLNIVKYESIDNYVCNSECGMGWAKEYLPQNAIDNLAYFNSRDQQIKILSGAANLELQAENYPALIFSIEELTDEITIEFPRLYYLGYVLTDSQGSTYNLENNKNGFLTATLNKNETYKLTYEGTLLERIALITKSITIILIIFLLISKIIINKKKENSSEKEKKMKKILILQLKGKSIGGISYVNQTLAQRFVKDNYKVHIVSLRDNHQTTYQESSKNVKTYTINSIDEWSFIRKNDLKEQLVKLKFINFFKLSLKCLGEQIQLHKDISNLKRIIIEYNPNYILVTHYQLLSAIPKDYLPKTIFEHHSSFNRVKDHPATRKTLKRYNGQISFVWLSHATCQEATIYGFKNNTYIYNPIKFTSPIISDVVANKKLITICRLSEEKRIDLMIELVAPILKKYPDWCLEIYGDGDEKEKLEKLIAGKTNIKLMGLTNDVKKVLLSSSISLNTSSYEGFALSILEANECGVPTISFDFGESASEEILNNETGYIATSKKDYQEKLEKLLTNKNELKRLSKNCKEFGKKFTINKIIDNWYKLFENIDKK